MADIVKLETRSSQVVTSVVETLEEVLRQAREGEIISVAIAVVHNDRSIGTTWSETDEFPILLGSISRLEYRVNLAQPAN